MVQDLVKLNGTGLDHGRLKKPQSLLDLLSPRLGPCPVFRKCHDVTNIRRLHLSGASNAAKNNISFCLTSEYKVDI